MELEKDVLGYLSLLPRRSPAEDVKADVEPVVDLLMEGIVLGAELFGRAFLLKRLGFSCGAIFIRPWNDVSRP